LGSVKFTVDGTTYSWIEQKDQTPANTFLLMNIEGSTAGTYFFIVSNAFSGSLIPAKEKVITFQAPVPLTTNTPFTLANTSTPSFPPHSIAVFTSTAFEPSRVYYASRIGDFATITITSIHDNNRADGNFTAELTRLSDSTSVNVTNGRFKNVKIVL